MDEAKEAAERVAVRREIRLRLKELGLPTMEINHIENLGELEEILYKLQKL